MSKYRFIFFDLDDTLFNFSKSQYDGIKKLLQKYDVSFDQDKYLNYQMINNKYWQLYEQNLIDIDQVRFMRFEEFFNTYGIVVDGKEVDSLYRNHLNNAYDLFNGVTELLASLYPNHNLYAASNGITTTQLSRLEKSDLKQYFRQIFISECIGFNKPDYEFFAYCANSIKNFDKDSAIIIGDSLSSDIIGGNKFGIDTCWFNPKNLENHTNYKPTYEVDNYDSLKQILHNK